MANSGLKPNDWSFDDLLAGKTGLGPNYVDDAIANMKQPPKVPMKYEVPNMNNSSTVLPHTGITSQSSMPRNVGMDFISNDMNTRVAVAKVVEKMKPEQISDLVTKAAQFNGIPVKEVGHVEIYKYLMSLR